VIHRERRRELWLRAVIAATWGLVYALLLATVLGDVGLIAGLAIGVYASSPEHGLGA
jgi:hypothetical protein